MTWMTVNNSISAMTGVPAPNPETNTDPAGAVERLTIRPSSWPILLAGIKQFGLAHDGADLQDLRAEFERKDGEIDRLLSRITELEKALGPFAIDRPDIPDGQPLRAYFDAGDLRAAASTLANKDG